MKTHVVALNSPWVYGRLQNIRDWWDLPFEFTYVNSNSPVEMKEWGQNLAVLDDPMINRWKDTDAEVNIFVAPYQPPKSFLGLIYDNRASVEGLCDMNTKCLQAFVNEKDSCYVTIDGVFTEIGKAFETWVDHELSHYFYASLGLVDRTHEFFYAGHPELARAEILAKKKIS